MFIQFANGEQFTVPIEYVAMLYADYKVLDQAGVVVGVDGDDGRLALYDLAYHSFMEKPDLVWFRANVAWSDIRSVAMKVRNSPNYDEMLSEAVLEA